MSPELRAPPARRPTPLEAAATKAKESQGKESDCLRKTLGPDDSPMSDRPWEESRAARILGCKSPS
ncbi:hypothetical protein AC249_AIPGENE10256, partial [Exaiptasia diaphana]